MRVEYKGYTIDVREEKCLAGYLLTYYSIFRKSDDYECASGYSDTADTIRQMIGFLKERVDNELNENDPWGEREEKDGINILESLVSQKEKEIERNKMQQQVLEFHKAFEVLAPDNPKIPSSDTRYLRKRLMEEELDELLCAMYKEDMVEIADGLADLLVVVFGTAISYGINMEPIFDEVHRSNMTKGWDDGVIRHNEYGKIIKSPKFKKPNLLPLLERQGWKDEKKEKTDSKKD